MRKIYVLLALVASLFAVPAYADFTGKDAAAATITFKNPGTCSSVVCVPVFQIYDGTNVVTLTTAGADAVSNTLTGVPMYGRNLVFNGTTWDRWQGAVTVAGVATAANQTTGNTSLATIATNSGTQATSANQTTINTSIGTTNTNLGPPGATACSTDTGSCAINALMQRVAQNLTTLNTTAGSATPAGTNLIGKVGIDQTTPGTTNAVSVQYGSTASVADPCQTATKVYTPVNVVTATNVIITAVAAKKKYICGIFLYPGGTDNIAVYQATTATSCATAATDIFGGHTAATGFLATAQAGFVVGNGASSFAATGTVNTDICITTSAAVQLSGVVVTVDQ